MSKTCARPADRRACSIGHADGRPYVVTGYGRGRSDRDVRSWRRWGHAKARCRCLTQKEAWPRADNSRLPA